MIGIKRRDDDDVDLMRFRSYNKLQILESEMELKIRTADMTWVYL